MVAALSIPVIANGDVLEYDDFARIKTATGTHDIEFIIHISGHVLMIILGLISELYNPSILMLSCFVKVLHR